MKISIIIPAYNEEKYLPLCLESIKDLDYSDDAVELIVVDNGSTDRTREITEFYGAKNFARTLWSLLMFELWFKRCYE